MDGPEQADARTVSEAQRQRSATAMEAAVREADAALTSGSATAEVATSPPLKGGEPTLGGNNDVPSTTAAVASEPTDAAALQTGDPSNASAYAATALAPQPSVLEPSNTPGCSTASGRGTSTGS